MAKAGVSLDELRLTLTKLHSSTRAAFLQVPHLTVAPISISSQCLISATGTPTGAEISAQEVSNDLASLRYCLSN